MNCQFVCPLELKKLKKKRHLTELYELSCAINFGKNPSKHRILTYRAIINKLPLFGLYGKISRTFIVFNKTSWKAKNAADLLFDISDCQHFFKDLISNGIIMIFFVS